MRKKRYIVVPRTEQAMMDGVRTGKRKLNFGNKTARWVDDPAEAHEIDTHYGLKGTGDVWVEQDENLEWHANNGEQTDGRNRGIHHYTFGPMRSKGAEEFWKRYERKKKQREAKPDRDRDAEHGNDKDVHGNVTT